MSLGRLKHRLNGELGGSFGQCGPVVRREGPVRCRTVEGLLTGHLDAVLGEA